MSTVAARPISIAGSTVPIIKDVSTIPVKPKEPTREAPFTHPDPKVVTSTRAVVRIVKARGRLVVVDSDLAELYGTTVDMVNKYVMRNACRFTRHTCFRLSNDEWHFLKGKAKGAAGLAEADRGNWLCAPLVFTEEGAEAVSHFFDTFESTRGRILIWKAIRKLEGNVERP